MKQKPTLQAIQLKGGNLFAVKITLPITKKYTLNITVTYRLTDHINVF